MTKYANEGRFQPGSGHSCAGPSRARLWVHGLVKGASAVTLGAYIGLHARILVHGAGPILISRDGTSSGLARSRLLRFRRCLPVPAFHWSSARPWPPLVLRRLRLTTSTRRAGSRSSAGRGNSGSSTRRRDFSLRRFSSAYRASFTAGIASPPSCSGRGSSRRPGA
jgi:hypothetical protein